MMYKIRKEQVDALSRASLQEYESQVIRHLFQVFPKKCREVGEAQVREDVRCAIQRAGEYGIISERDVSLYLHLMFALGRDFDRDPKLPWAAQCLNDRSVPDPTTRIERLYDLADQKLRQGGAQE
jgi:hypothetical protein